jgi:3'-phosphoadenosine 5'-phosphosulfate sulfotransferase (PAPS reductase)/FAD synthetase
VRGKQYAWLLPHDTFSLPEFSEFYGAEYAGVTVSLPIVDWTTEATFQFLADRGDTVNPLYSRGHKRVGCYPCMLADAHEWNAAANDPIGRTHMARLVQIQKKWETEPPLHKRTGEPHKLIRMERDVEGMLDQGRLFTDDGTMGCGWCSI